MDKSTRLAYDRTFLAYERTMQAWIRTATSLITFGFSVAKLTDVFATTPGQRARIAGPQEFGTILVCIGFFALFMAIIVYRQSMRALRMEYGKSPMSLSLWLAATVAFLGVFALAVMFAHR
jgi:inner membrane protein YidH